MLVPDWLNSRVAVEVNQLDNSTISLPGTHTQDGIR